MSDSTPVAYCLLDFRSVAKKVAFSGAHYLGGLPDSSPSRVGTNFIVTDDGIGVKKAFTRWPDVEGVSFDPSTPKLSGPALVGTLALIGSARVGTGAHVAVALRTGSVGLYRLTGWTPSKVRQMVEPFMAANAVRCLDS